MLGGFFKGPSPDAKVDTQQFRWDRLLDTHHLFHRSNLDGSNVEKFTTTAVQDLFKHLQGIAFDPINRKIYANQLFKMFVINTDDLYIQPADIELEWELNSTDVEYFTLDIDDRKIYWVRSSFGGVYRANLDGTNREEVLSGSVAATVDFNTRKIYWAPSHHLADMKMVWQTNLDGSGTEALFAVEHEISYIAV